MVREQAYHIISDGFGERPKSNLCELVYSAGYIARQCGVNLLSCIQSRTLTCLRAWTTHMFLSTNFIAFASSAITLRYHSEYFCALSSFIGLHGFVLSAQCSE